MKVVRRAKSPTFLLDTEQQAGCSPLSTWPLHWTPLFLQVWLAYTATGSSSILEPSCGASTSRSAVTGLLVPGWPQTPP